MGGNAVPGTQRHGTRYRFEGFELEPRERRLLARGQPVTLAPKVFNTLVLLVERAGHVVTKDELMAALWPRGFVSESNLTKHIWAIRKALAHGCGRDTCCIETVSKLGYRFVAPVETIESCDTGDVEEDPAPLVDDTEAAHGDLPAVDDVPQAPQPPAPPPTQDGAAVEKRVFGRRESDRALARTLIHMDAARKRRRRWGVAIAAAGLLVLGSIAGDIAWRRAAASHPQAGANPAGSAVAIVGFDNLTHDPGDAWLGPALVEMLGTEISASGELHTLPSGLVNAARTALRSNRVGGYAPDALAKLHQRLGADYVVSGTYLVSGAGVGAILRVDVVVQDARKGVDIARLSRSGPVSSMPALVTTVGVALRDSLDLAPMAPDLHEQVARAQPPTTDVARHIGFALDALQRFDGAQARDDLLLAVAAAPDYAPARMLLARAWMMLGYRGKALAEIRRAAQHAHDLSPDQRIQIQARRFEVQQDWASAAAASEKLVERLPDVLAYRLSLARDLAKAGQFERARQVLDQARKLALPLAFDPRIELMAWHVAYLDGELAEEARHAAKALSEARAIGAPDLVADSEYFLGHSYGRLGKPEASRRLLQAAYDYYRKSGDEEGQASVERRLGWLAEWQNDLAGAKQAYQDALSLYQAIGNRFWQSQVYLGLADIQMHANDADAALASARQALQLAREAGEVDQQAHATGWVAHVEARNGQGDQALKDFRESIRLYGHALDKTGLPWTQAHYGNALVARGRLDAAQEICDRMRPLIRGGDPHGKEYALLTCMCVGATRGNRNAAVMDAKQLAATAKARGDRAMYATALLRRARLAINYGGWHVAWKNLVELADMPQNDAGTQAMVQAWMALTANALGNLAARDRAATRARELRSKLGSHAATFDVDLALARLRGERGDTQPALADLAALASGARHRGDIDSALKAELIRVKLLAKNRDPRAAKARSALAAEARHDGFGWIVQRLAAPAPAGGDVGAGLRRLRHVAGAKQLPASALAATSH